MALHYKTSLTGSMLMIDIDAHVKWRNRILHYVLFPTVAVEGIERASPVALINWCRLPENLENLEGSKKTEIEKLITLHQELDAAGLALITPVEQGQGITLELYDAYEVSFEAYISYITILEQSLTRIGGGIDPVTGMRTVSGMQEDFKRELDRRDRKGLAFCICVVEIDGIDKIKKYNDTVNQNAIFENTAGVFLQTVRSFDDVYHQGSGKIFLCLKHIDLLDACSVMDRIREQVLRKRMDFDVPGEGKVRITISVGVAEPIPGDKIEDVVDNASRALKRAQGYGGNKVEQHQEISRLEQFAKET